MKRTLQPLTQAAFAPFGDVLEMRGEADFPFNDNRALRWHDLARIDVDEKGRIGVSLCQSNPITLPFALELVERHPLGSQGFMPLDDRPFVVFVAHDHDGTPSEPLAFLTNGRQGINFHRGTWHGVLSPLDAPQNFVIFDRAHGEGVNLEVHSYPSAFLFDK